MKVIIGLILGIILIYSSFYQLGFANEYGEGLKAQLKELEKSEQTIKEKRIVDEFDIANQRKLPQKPGYSWIFTVAKCDVEFTKCHQYEYGIVRKLGSERDFKANIIKTLMMYEIKKDDIRIMHRYSIPEMSNSAIGESLIHILIPSDKICKSIGLGFYPLSVDDQMKYYKDGSCSAPLNETWVESDSKKYTKIWNDYLTTCKDNWKSCPDTTFQSRIQSYFKEKGITVLGVNYGNGEHKEQTKLLLLIPNHDIDKITKFGFTIKKRT